VSSAMEAQSFVSRYDRIGQQALLEYLSRELIRKVMEAANEWLRVAEEQSRRSPAGRLRRGRRDGQRQMTPTWRKSTHSGAQEGDCVEVAVTENTDDRSL
jgi:Domain of unknown function (DUF397)